MQITKLSKLYVNIDRIKKNGFVVPFVWLVIIGYATRRTFDTNHFLCVWLIKTIQENDYIDFFDVATYCLCFVGFFSFFFFAHVECPVACWNFI